MIINITFVFGTFKKTSPLRPSTTSTELSASFQTPLTGN